MAKSKRKAVKRAKPAAQPGAPVTIRDVARKAHVSLSSVSRVLTEHPDVSRPMQPRVLRATAALGYEPDFIAQSLRRGVTHTLGFLIGDISNPVFADVIRGAEDHARSQGYAIMLTNSEGDPELDARYLHLFLRRKVDGIILSTAETGSPQVARALLDPTVPFVVLDRDVPPNSKVSTVFGDHASGMRQATTHLIERGHTAIAFISGPEHLKPSRERIRGFRTAFEAAGLKPNPDFVRIGSLRPNFGRDQAVDLLRHADRPTAIIAGSNRLLTGVLEGVQQSDLVVGRDLALAGCDDVDLARLYRPPISVVIRDQYRLGQVACELIIERLANPDAPVRTVTLPTQFVARASSDFRWPPSN
jgi:LacI family transcriptional regulator